MISIKEPMWNGRYVGLAEYRLGVTETEVEILYKDKEGNRIYPHVYTVKTDDVKKYSQMKLKNNGIVLRMVPIADLKIKGER